MKDELMIQCTFEDNDTFTVGWIPNDKRVKPGCKVELIDPETKEHRFFNVIKVSRPVNRDLINRGWHNNI